MTSWGLPGRSSLALMLKIRIMRTQNSDMRTKCDKLTLSKSAKTKAYAIVSADVENVYLSHLLHISEKKISSSRSNAFRYLLLKKVTKTKSRAFPLLQRLIFGVHQVLHEAL